MQSEYSYGRSQQFWIIYWVPLFVTNTNFVLLLYTPQIAVSYSKKLVNLKFTFGQLKKIIYLFSYQVQLLQQINSTYKYI